MAFNPRYPEDGPCAIEPEPDYAAIERAVIRAMNDEFGGREYVDGDDEDEDEDEF